MFSESLLQDFYHNSQTRRSLFDATIFVIRLDLEPTGFHCWVRKLRIHFSAHLILQGWEKRLMAKKNPEGRRLRIEVALEELKLLEEIIGRYDDNEIKIRSWLLALLSALIVASISERVSASVELLAFIAPGVTLSFAAIELIHRVPKRKAIERVGDIEEMLRGEREYNGPLITESLMSKPKLVQILAEIRILPVLGFYGLILALTLFFILFKHY